MAPSILIIIYFLKYKNIETHARAFLPLNISAVGSVHWTYFWLLFLCSMRERDFIQVSESDGDEIRENGDAYLQKIKEKATSNKCLVYPSISMSSQEVKGESRWWLGGNHGQCTEVCFDTFFSGRCIFIEMVDHGQPLVQVSRSTRTEPAGRRRRKKIS